MKQTAVEHLAIILKGLLWHRKRNRITPEEFENRLNEELCNALQMEREQIEEAFDHGYDNMINASNYYTKTYGKEEQK